MNELDHVTQQNAAMFEETTAASHALSSEADSLAAAVSQFNLGGAYASIDHQKASSDAVQGFESKRSKSAKVASPVTAGNTALAVETEAGPEIDTGREEF